MAKADPKGAAEAADREAAIEKARLRKIKEESEKPDDTRNINFGMAF